MKRRQLAKEIEAPATTLNSAFARKSKSFSVGTIGKIAKVLDVPTNYLLCVEPFEDINVLQENKEYILEVLEEVGVFKKIPRPSNIDDSSYYLILDTFVTSVTFSEEGLVIVYKVFNEEEIDMSQDIEIPVDLMADFAKLLSSESINFQNFSGSELERFKSIFNDKAIETILKYSQLDSDEREKLRQKLQIVELEGQASIGMSVSVAPDGFEVIKAKGREAKINKDGE